jgi:hypothetical protein
MRRLGSPNTMMCLLEMMGRDAMPDYRTSLRWLIGSALGAIVASFLIGLLGMLTKVLLTGNGVAYFASVAGAILAIAVAGPGCWWTLAIVFRAVAKRNAASQRRLSYAQAGLIWGLAHSLLAILLCGLEVIGSLTRSAYVISLLTGTAVTSAMIYLPPAPDHAFILLAPAVAGWVAGLIFGRINRNRPVKIPAAGVRAAGTVSGAV